MPWIMLVVLLFAVGLTASSVHPGTQQTPPSQSQNR